MPKAYAVAHVQRRPGSCFSGTFYNSQNVRVTRSLESMDENTAKRVCQGLVALRDTKATFDSIPLGVHPTSVKLYFSLKTEVELSPPANYQETLTKSQEIELEICTTGTPEMIRAHSYKLLMERYSLRQELDNLQLQNQVLKETIHKDRIELEALKRSVLARVVGSTTRMPDLDMSLDLFEKSLATCTVGYRKTIMSFARKFVAYLPHEIEKLSDVKKADIANFLTEQAASKPTKTPVARRYNLHLRLAAFINWAAKTYEYPSQMPASISDNALSRERGEIIWHEQAEVEAAIAAQEGAYWPALIATLAYAGPQLAELVWLRRKDVDLEKGTLWIGPVTDPLDKNVSHKLKTGNRSRHVNIHPTLLLPRLQAFVEAGHAGEHYFFAKPARMAHKRNHKGGALERWAESGLSTSLRGHMGGRTDSSHFRNPTPGILPKGMNARTLRHTFGSLLLRSGKSHAECAAAMGHSETVNRKFYAKWKGSEIKVNF